MVSFIHFKFIWHLFCCILCIVGGYPNTIVSSLNKCHLCLSLQYNLNKNTAFNFQMQSILTKYLLCAVHDIMFLIFPSGRNADKILRTMMQKPPLVDKTKKNFKIKSFLLSAETGYDHIHWDKELVQAASKENTKGSL